MSVMSVQGSLQNCYKKPWNKLKQEQRLIAEKLAAKRNRKWDEMSPAEREDAAKSWDKQQSLKLEIKLNRLDRMGSPKEGSLEAAGHTLGFWDATMHAASWFEMTALSPSDAASLLCCSDPLDSDRDPESITTDETSPDDFRLLLRVFSDVHQTDPRGRRLVEWLVLAGTRGCKQHHWLGQYLEARTRLGFPVAPIVAEEAPPTHDEEPDESASASGDKTDYSLLASREQLIEAFGSFTGMNASWFDNLSDKPELMAARAFKGKSGRGGWSPLFNPFTVMNWLIDPKRKTGKGISEVTAWRMLKAHFPKVHAMYLDSDPSGY